MSTYVQNLNLLQPKLWPVVQFTDQCANKLTYDVNKKYSYNDSNNYKGTSWKCDNLSPAEITAELKINKVQQLFIILFHNMCQQ